MDTKLEQAFRQLEEARLRLLKEIEACPESQRRFKPSDREWSMVQVVTHLTHTEKGIQSYMQAKMNKGLPLKPARLAAWFRFWIVVLFLRYKRRIKAPAVVTMPPDAFSFEQAQQTWADSRMQFRSFLEAMPANTAHKEIFRHPITGMLNVYQTLGFMREHVLHHLGQVRRLKAMQKA
jgi:uncharacterized damage-inducible protein DinB